MKILCTKTENFYQVLHYIKEKIMDTSIHSIGSLFDQLGLASTEESINRFVESNGQLSSKIEFHKVFSGIHQKHIF